MILSKKIVRVVLKISIKMQQQQNKNKCMNVQKHKVIRSRDVPGSPGKVPELDRTGPRDLEGPVVPWSRD